MSYKKEREKSINWFSPQSRKRWKNASPWIWNFEYLIVEFYYWLPPNIMEVIGIQKWFCPHFIIKPWHIYIRAVIWMHPTFTLTLFGPFHLFIYFFQCIIPFGRFCMALHLSLLHLSFFFQFNVLSTRVHYLCILDIHGLFSSSTFFYLYLDFSSLSFDRVGKKEIDTQIKVELTLDSVSDKPPCSIYI